MATCYRHPSRETGVSCSNCGRPICPDCMTPTPVGMRCPECAKQKTEVRALTGTRGGLEVTIVLIVINVIVFIAEVSSGASFGRAGGSSQIIEKGALYGPAIADGGEYWRLVTGGFLHSGFLHILFNMYLLWILGQMLEPALGRWRFAAIYFVSLLGGAFGALLLNPDSVTVGASGAVFGLMGAAFVDQRSRGVDPMQTGIGGLIVINLVISFLIPNISIGGHIGGLIAGGLAALVLQQADRRRSALLGLAGCVLLAVVAVAAAIAAAQSGTTTV
jgi:membrane associated rhomboid family serine protease